MRSQISRIDRVPVPKRKGELKTSSQRVTPLYHRLYQHLRQKILEQAFDPGESLPSEPTLAKTYGVSRVTVRKTFDQLEHEGLIRRIQGRGTFPVKRADANTKDAKTNISGLLENLLSFEQATSAVNLSWDLVTPDDGIAKLLDQTICLRIRRLRSFNGVPISFSTIFVPKRFAKLLSPAAAADEPIIKVLDRKGVLAARAEQVITAVSADAMAARHLTVKRGSPLICMRRLMVDSEQEPILYQESSYAPDKFEYRMTLLRADIGPAARWTPIA
jgi:GntR family transcriptional regulator